jgi:membrane-associated HD superfamily phosphohydrolase
LTASGCARGLTGLGFTATLAVGSALVRAARRGGAFFAAFFRMILVFLTVFLCFVLLVTVVFRRFALALVVFAMAASLTLTAFQSLRSIVTE